LRPTDPFEIVRILYQAINDRDVDALARLYAPDILAEQVFDGTFVIEGRDEVLRAYAQLFATWRGRIEPHTIGGIQTGWGWSQADWTETATGEEGTISHRVGHSHFLIENGQVRRHRRVITAKGEGPAPVEPARHSSRRYPSRPITGVGAVILMQGGVVLIRRRHEPLAGHWSLPGGTLDLGETLQAAVAREALEETGLVVDVGPLVEVFDRILLDDEGKVRYHFVLVDYLCRPVSGELRAGSDATGVAIATAGDLPKYRLAAKAFDVIQKALLMKDSW
jgi:8-oxo-dGTP diphosphatase